MNKIPVEEIREMKNMNQEQRRKHSKIKRMPGSFRKTKLQDCRVVSCPPLLNGSKSKFFIFLFFEWMK